MPVARTRSGELLVTLDRASPAPLHRQLERELRSAVRSGRLRPGAALPSSRALAGQLGLSRGVVVEAYEQLVAEGYLTARPGGATRVSERATPPAPAAAARPAVPSPAIAFAYGKPDVTAFPRSAWLRSIRRVLESTPADGLTYSEGPGAPELRTALASYLDRVRGTAADPDRIVVSSGFTQALWLLAGVVRALGGTRFAMEHPGYQDVPHVIERSGLELVRVPVDERGLDVDRLARTGADVVLVTPAHQYPTGAVLAPERRAALVAWAVRTGALVVEDDYDAEFRYDREPIGALQGLAPEHVVYAGSASKTLAPGLRLGWLVVPARLVEPLARDKVLADGGSAALEQLAFADFLERGEFDHHLRRMRPAYRRRRDALLEALASHAPDLRPAGASAGLHVLVWLPPDVDEDAVVAAARELGVGVGGLRRFHAGIPLPGALLFGYGTLAERQIVEGVRLVGRAVERVRAGTISEPAPRPGRPTSRGRRRGAATRASG